MQKHFVIVSTSLEHLRGLVGFSPITCHYVRATDCKLASDARSCRCTTLLDDGDFLLRETTAHRLWSNIYLIRWQKRSPHTLCLAVHGEELYLRESRAKRANTTDRQWSRSACDIA